MKLLGPWSDCGQLLRNIGSNSQIRHRNLIKYFCKKNYFSFLQSPSSFKNVVIFALILAVLRACKIVASACTFGPKIGSTKARQNNGRCDVTSPEFV